MWKDHFQDEVISVQVLVLLSCLANIAIKILSLKVTIKIECDAHCTLRPKKPCWSQNKFSRALGPSLPQNVLSKDCGTMTSIRG